MTRWSNSDFLFKRKNDAGWLHRHDYETNLAYLNNIGTRKGGKGIQPPKDRLYPLNGDDGEKMFRE